MKPTLYHLKLQHCKRTAFQGRRRNLYSAIIPMKIPTKLLFLTDENGRQRFRNKGVKSGQISYKPKAKTMNVDGLVEPSAPTAYLLASCQRLMPSAEGLTRYFCSLVAEVHGCLESDQ